MGLALVLERTFAPAVPLQWLKCRCLRNALLRTSSLPDAKRPRAGLDMRARLQLQCRLLIAATDPVGPRAWGPSVASAAKPCGYQNMPGVGRNLFEKQYCLLRKFLVQPLLLL